MNMDQNQSFAYYNQWNSQVLRSSSDFLFSIILWALFIDEAWILDSFRKFFAPVKSLLKPLFIDSVSPHEYG